MVFVYLRQNVRMHRLQTKKPGNGSRLSSFVTENDPAA
jgi:hypothetical protein